MCFFSITIFDDSEYFRISWRSFHILKVSGHPRPAQKFLSEYSRSRNYIIFLDLICDIRSKKEIFAACFFFTISSSPGSYMAVYHYSRHQCTWVNIRNRYPVIRHLLAIIDMVVRPHNPPRYKECFCETPLVYLKKLKPFSTLQ